MILFNRFAHSAGPGLMVHWLIDWVIDWFIDWLIDGLIHGPNIGRKFTPKLAENTHKICWKFTNNWSEF
jgi:hypothetical protein